MLGIEPSTPLSQMTGKSIKNRAGGDENTPSLAQCCTPSPTLGNHTFKASLGYTKRHCLKQTTNKQAKTAPPWDARALSPQFVQQSFI